MKRTIKFRAFLPIGEWDEEGESQAYEMCHDLAYEDYAPVNDNLASTPNLMQYIGMLDKNERSIYEGDIVEYSYTTEDSKESFTVEYVAPSFLFRSHDDKNHWNISEYDFKNIEVTGNIHEGARHLVKESK